MIASILDKYNNYKFTLSKKQKNDLKYKGYLVLKPTKFIKKNLGKLRKEIDKLLGELSILKEKSIKFARNSREITAKSYGLGNSTYVELLQSELKLQKILMHKVMLESKRDIKRVTLKYVKGEPLNE